ncbi:unnamed protein product, partial [Mesorhabditis belari]|uniref:Uncharacterized protein n=1 Tax=Mesorhabditis belari TaxID=2138241 RepID=A0AAF3J9L2_9BILA
MAGTADAAKNALSSIFDKAKDVVGTAAEATKGYASQAQQAIGKVIPGMSVDHSAQDPSVVQPAETAAPAPPPPQQ